MFHLCAGFAVRRCGGILQKRRSFRWFVCLVGPLTHIFGLDQPTTNSMSCLHPPPRLDLHCRLVSSRLKAGPGVRVASVSVLCCRLLERLESGHAVRLRVDGELVDGVYSSGGAEQKRQELVLHQQEKQKTPVGSGTVGGGHGGGRSSAGKKEGEGRAAGSKVVEVVPWEAAGRVLLACPFATKLPMLRYCTPLFFRAFVCVWRCPCLRCFISVPPSLPHQNVRAAPC